MTWYHGLQLALAAGAALVIVQQRRNHPATRDASEDDLDAMARGVYLLRGLGRIAMPLAFVGVILELGRGIESAEGGTGGVLAGNAALADSIVGLAIGACTATACLGVATSLRRRVLRAQRRHERATGLLDRAQGDV